MLRRTLLYAKRANTNSQKTFSQVDLTKPRRACHDQHQTIGLEVLRSSQHFCSDFLSAAAITRTTPSRRHVVNENQLELQIHC